MDFYLIARIAAFAYDRNLDSIEAFDTPSFTRRLSLTWRNAGFTHFAYLNI